MTQKILAVFAVSLLFGIVPASAQTAPAQTAAAPEPYATVGILNATTTAQSSNAITFSFELRNREGVQPGVRYGVALLRVAEGKPILFDEYVYDETLTLGTGESVKRTVAYVAPEHLSGAYSLVLSAKSASGVHFADAPLGPVTLPGRADVLSVDPVSCVITGENGARYALGQKVSVSDPKGQLGIRCAVRNGTKTAVSLSPQITQRLRSAYGDKVPGTGAPATPITIAAGATAQVAVVVGVMPTPQTYHVALSLRDAQVGKSTNTVSFEYALRGPGASLETLSLDKDAYGAGDTAIVSLRWSPFSGSVAGGAMEARVFMLNGAGGSCGAPVVHPLTADSRAVEVPYPITADCRDPQVTAEIVDSLYGTLDTQTFSVVSRANPFLSVLMSFFTNVYVLAGILALALIAGVAQSLTRRNVPPPPPPAPGPVSPPPPSAQ